jgi:beta-galactosidase/beta-glucuronidase
VHSSTEGTSAQAEVTVHKDGKTVATHTGPTNKPFQFTVSSPKLWSPDSPNLYNVTVKLGKDKVESYTGFRTISRGKIDGIERPLLNGEFIFMFGTLDQGYWPDGLYTPPNLEAMVYDLKFLKKLGFNMVRKHVSIATSHPISFLFSCSHCEP